MIAFNISVSRIVMNKALRAKLMCQNQHRFANMCSLQFASEHKFFTVEKREYLIRVGIAFYSPNNYIY